MTVEEQYCAFHRDSNIVHFIVTRTSQRHAAMLDQQYAIPRPRNTWQKDTEELGFSFCQHKTTLKQTLGHYHPDKKIVPHMCDPQLFQLVLCSITNTCTHMYAYRLCMVCLVSQ